ncbi:hypothetical protein MS3_00001710 [Schistosoma haematobium]|uniref:Uncharacterized protein n=1 Tax=Schistosoma haematobium TaxID=6185 RepID=A0A6A5D6S0_SCHHA|nr:hypothetical protein MS3_00001710 [Schistosoma haematobium]KAH9595786.1 hypothetical protein MS3_00001710 [Schistosoma haematobium]
MGGRSGKFVVPHTAEKTEDSLRKPDAVEQVKALDSEQSVQLLNGVVTAGPDVPCIDEVTEHTDDVKLENGHKERCSPGEENHEQANGDVTKSDVPQNEDAKRTKKGNPISRILRRISRKGSNLKKHSTDNTCEKPEDTNNDEKQEVTTTEAQSPECTANSNVDPTSVSPVLLVADNLVQDVIISATQTRLEEIQVCEVRPYEENYSHTETKNDTQESLSEVEISHVSSCVNESYVNGEPVNESIDKSEDVLVNGVHAHEEVNGVDCNNANGYVDDNVIQSKLANLELINGHSEVNGFHYETKNSVMVSNDY